MKKIKHATVFLALMLGIGAFLLPMTAYAQTEADTTPPALHASLSGGTIHIEASDEGSGIDAVFIGGRRAEFSGSTLDVPFSEYATDGQDTLEIYAKDCAGNQSEAVEVVKTANPLTPGGQATVVDDATDGDGKEFYTFTTPDESVFYLVIDRQRDSENVYFLNAVTEEDLGMLAQKAAEEGGSGSAGLAEEACSCKEKCTVGVVNTACPICRNDLVLCSGPEPEEPVLETAGQKEPEDTKQEGTGSGTIFFLVIAVLAAGGAGWYFKIYRPKRELDEAEDLLDDGPEVNEDGPDAGETRPGDQDSHESRELSGEEQGPEPDTCREGGMAEYDDYPYDDFSYGGSPDGSYPYDGSLDGEGGEG